MPRLHMSVYLALYNEVLQKSNLTFKEPQPIPQGGLALQLHAHHHLFGTLEVSAQLLLAALKLTLCPKVCQVFQFATYEGIWKLGSRQRPELSTKCQIYFPKMQCKILFPYKKSVFVDKLVEW